MALYVHAVPFVLYCCIVTLVINLILYLTECTEYNHFYLVSYL